MKKNCKKVKLTKGLVEICETGIIKLHSYKTNDPINNTVFILEKNKDAIIIEQPCFFDNIEELAGYIKVLGVCVKAKILPYHMAGGTFLPEVPVYATKKAEDYGHTGGGKSLINNFSLIFGQAFDPSVSKVTGIIEAGNTEITGMRIKIIETNEAFDIELQEMNSIYSHMLGSDTHSIVAGANHADVIIAQLKDFIAKKYDLILSSHHMPETLDDVKIKIAYLDELKKIASNSSDAKTFKSAVKSNFPSYYGENYLDMTAGFFFPNK